jgi:hypothetical protein
MLKIVKELCMKEDPFVHLNKMELEADNAGITEVLEKSMYCMI